VAGPYSRTTTGYEAKLPKTIGEGASESLLLFRNGFLGDVAKNVASGNTLVVAPPDWTQQQVDATRFEIVRGTVQDIEQPLQHRAGFMYYASRPDLTCLADSNSPSGDTSPIFVFEDQQQLGFPHAFHDQIIRYGLLRFSHWGDHILFSASDNSDPRTNGRKYQLVVADKGSRCWRDMPKIIKCS
jgi:hypothetical protein